MNSKVYLAPMSGVTDFSFRKICRRFGAELCFFEMLDANAIVYGHPGTLRLIMTGKHDKPIAAQLVGCDPAVMLEASLRLLSRVEISFLDINCACPAKKVVKKGAGAYLLHDTRTLAKILSKLTRVLSVPVTAKIRIGYGKKDLSAILSVAETIQECGASALFVHGRTMFEGYAGDIDYGTIFAIKNVLTIPVIGSGNIFNPYMAKKMIDETGCDGVLVARGALGNPWIFRDISTYLRDGSVTGRPGLSARKRVLKQHLSYVEKYKELRIHDKVGFMGKIAMWYLKGLPGATRIREGICRVRTYDELVRLIDGIEHCHEELLESKKTRDALIIR